ncbi:MAG: hypothetical protein ABW360_03000 [Phenylobacterium sp.]
MRDTSEIPDGLHPFDEALLALGGPILLAVSDAAAAWALARSQRRGAPKEALASRPAVGALAKRLGG